MIFRKIPRIRLLEDATPLQPLKRLGESWGHPHLYIKREDVIPDGLGGNKVRAAEFWFAEAISNGADLILVAGRPASNQCRVVAAVACKLGLECHVMHNSERPEMLKGNQLLHHLLGVTQIFLGPVSDEERAIRLQEYAKEQERKGRRPYIVADPVLGALGYVKAVLELHEQADRKGYDISHLFLAGSMGPTEAGLLWGAALLGHAFDVTTPSVEYPKEVIREMIMDICHKLDAKFGFSPAVNPRELLTTMDDTLGPGYDIPTEEAVAVARELASHEGIFIETTYNAKVFAALKRLLSKEKIPQDEGICIFHTGGIPALFGQAERFMI